MGFRVPGPGGRFFDDARFPTVVARAPSGAEAERDVGAFYAEWDEVLARGPHVVLLDLRAVDSSLLGARVRRAVADAARRRRNCFRRHLRAEARLCSGPLVRAVMSSIDWMAGESSGHPVAYFDDETAALDWLRGRLASPTSEEPAAELG